MSQTIRQDDEIHDAASLVVVEARGTTSRVLMGRRLPSQVFLPNKWVFPGGRVDLVDRVSAAAGEHGYCPCDLAADVRPFALAAARELFEETGLAAGRMEPGGFVPEPHRLLPLARAVTPPGRVRRFDTWFFIAARSAILESGKEGDGEFSAIAWFTIEEARGLDLPVITRLVLEDISTAIAASRGNDVRAVPFYRHDGVSFRRDLISCSHTFR